MSTKKILLIVAFLSASMILQAAQRSTENLSSVVYECNTIPSLANPVWDLWKADPNENTLINSDGNVIDINCLDDATAIGYWLPGQWAKYDTDPINPNNSHYTYGDANNPWKPDYDLGYTIELSTEIIDTYKGRSNFCYEIRLIEDYTEALCNFEIYEDRITAVVGQQVPMYIGDLTSKQHKIRFVRYPGNMLDPNDDPNVSLYVDGVLKYNGGAYSEAGDGNIMYVVPGANKRDTFFMGGQSSLARYHVNTDYIRMDFTGAYEPPAAEEPVLADYNETYSIVDYNTIFDSNQSCMPSVVLANNGDLVCSFVTEGDINPGCKLYITRSHDLGKTWTLDPNIEYSSSYGSAGGVLGYLSNDSDGNILLALQDTYGPVYSNRISTIDIYKSTNNGYSFSYVSTVPVDANCLNVMGGPILIAGNDDLLLPGYYNKYLDSNAVPNVVTFSGFWRSTDDGNNWEQEIIFKDAIENSLVDYYRFNEIDIVKCLDDSLLAVVRTDAIKGPETWDAWGVLYYSTSNDNGYTWTRPRSTGLDGHSPALALWPNTGAVMLGCRNFTAEGNKTSVYISPNADGGNFLFAFDAIETRDKRNTATGYPTFANINNTDIFMAFYAGDPCLPWPLTTYLAGNMLHETSPFSYSYDANQLPSAASPAYSYASGTQTMTEASYASVSSGILTLNSNSDGQDSDSGWYTLNGGSGTSWDPNTGGPFAMEIRMKSLANNSSSYNCWLRWFDGNSSILLQVWYNKVYLNGTEVTGLDNTDFHTYRIVSEQYVSSTQQKFDLYRDGLLIINDAVNVVNNTSRCVQIGDCTGSAESNIQIDYIRWDDDANNVANYEYSYDANVLPSAASPPYTYFSPWIINAEESECASVSSGVLVIDTNSDGLDSDSAWYNFTGGPGTSWNPSFGGSYTMEARIQALNSYATTYNCFFEWYDLNSVVRLQVWKDRVKLNASEVTNLKNDDDYHVYRIVSYKSDSSVNQKFDLYRDGDLIIKDAANIVNNSPPKVAFGDMTGANEVNIKIDYLRWNDKMAMEP